MGKVFLDITMSLDGKLVVSYTCGDVGQASIFWEQGPE